MVSEARNRRWCSSGGGGEFGGRTRRLKGTHRRGRGATRAREPGMGDRAGAARAHTTEVGRRKGTQTGYWGRGGEGGPDRPGSTRAHTAGGGAPRGHAGRGGRQDWAGASRARTAEAGRREGTQAGKGVLPAPQGYAPLGGAPRGHTGRWGFAPVPPRSRKEGRGVRRRGMVAVAQSRKARQVS